ncbi:MAG TPA: alpha/beta fold hydrolase [Xanthomonadaceae bacterium]|nr:alpha/beta fold hydrolase [Xanthomonadaceae bacterium]
MPATFPDYPFASNWFDRGAGIRMHYLDEGPRDAPPVLMVHGNPSWSYYWRHLVLALRGRYRCIVPDHIGMGLSDKPGDDAYRHTLAWRIQDLDRLLAHLGIDRDLTVAVHDWGGAIALGWAVRHATAVRRLVILNTAAFPLPAGKRLPWTLRLVRNTGLGAWLVCRLNAFARGAAWLGVYRRLAREERRALLAPYDTPAHRLATLRFVRDIPVQDTDPAWGPLVDTERRLGLLADRPTLLCWGLRDFVFDEDYLNQFVRRFPGAEVHAYEDAAHYVLEDARARILGAVESFLQRHPL